MEIKEFYNGCSIFITGGSGFMGKVLIEKLLRSCPGIDKIYVLMRSRNHMGIHNRIKDMLNLPLFDKIREETPGIAEKKLIPVLGDLREIKLGLNDDDYETLTKNVSIVFHVAATVRFDEPLRDAIIMNVRGTREVVRLAEQMKSLKIFLHVSTTYCNCNRIYVEEKIYEPPVGWHDAILIAENLDPKISEVLSAQFLGSFPNAYTFTKLLAEQIIKEESKRVFCNNNIPIIVFRPSIVISTVEEPIVGWVENLNGPIGFMAGFGKGVALVTLADKDNILDIMPVDHSIKAMIVAAYHHGTHNFQSDNNLSVYNCSSVKESITISTISEIGLLYILKHPFDEVLWRPRVHITSSKLLFYILLIMQQVSLAFFVDSMLSAVGKKSTINLMRLQRKIYLATMALSYFSLQTWTFDNTNFLSLLNRIPDSENQDFNFKIDDFDFHVVVKNLLIGSQKYLFRNSTDPRKIKQATIRLKILIWLDRLLISIVFILISWCTLKILNIFPKVDFINFILKKISFL